MPVVSHRILNPDGTVPDRAQVTVELIASSSRYAPAEGHVTGSGLSVSGIARPALDPTGTWTLVLTPNAQITPAGSVYRVTETLPGQRSIELFFAVTPAGGGVETMLAASPFANA